MRRNFLGTLLLTAALPLAAFCADETALDRYIRTPDAAYRWSLTSTSPGLGFTTYVLDMVSQRWLTEADVDRPEWRHSIVIVKPDKLSTSTGVLVIDGGSNSDSAPSASPMLAALALQSGAVVADVLTVPNQPLKFAGESQARSEDAIIAYSWKKFLETGDERWPARLPMTKAAVRAMDAVQEFLRGSSGPGIDIPRFLVAGASKRGWTTWSTALVDKRVVGIVPLVIDILNLQASFTHHWRSYGFWAPAIQDYANAGVMNYLGTDQIRALAAIEDPYEYRERLALPKYIVASTGDQFFLPDSSQFYFNDLPGEKYIRYLPNTDHYLQSPDLLYDLAAWLDGLINNRPRPRFWWRADRSAGTIRLATLDDPSQVLLWQAANPNARDFRLETIGPAWTSSPVQGSNGVYTVTLPAPASGYAAFFLEMTYPSGGPFPWHFTTEVVVTPDVYPFDLPPSGQ